MSAILLERDIVHYEVLGRGRPVIFLHGWVGSWRYWIPAMQAASISYRAYALDLWGYGDTTKNQGNFPVEKQIKLIEQFFDQMGIMKAAFVGHGLGSVLALLFANKYPHAVDRMMLVSYPLDFALINPRMRKSSPAEIVEWLLGRNGISEPVLTESAKTDPAALQVAFNELSLLLLRDLWRGNNAACLMVSGEKDQAVQSASPELLGESPYNTHAISFDQSGHFPMLEENSKFNRLLADFLALPSGDSPRELQLKDEWKRRVR